MSREIDQSAAELSELDVSKRVKVLRIIARMNIGGPAVQVTGLMRELDPILFEQKLVTGYVASDEADYLLENKIDIPVTRVEGLGRSINIAADLKAFFKLVKIIRDFRPDIIHTHTAKAGVLGRTAWILAGYKPKLVHTFHGHLLHGYFGKFKTFLVIQVEKILEKFTNKILVVGIKTAEDLIKVKITKWSKVSVMPPGLKIGQIPDRNQVLKKYNLDDHFYCTFLGRVTKIKNPERFLEVASIIQKSSSDLKFLIVGAGDLMENIENNIKINNLPIFSLGWITNIEEILAITNLMILTSENEGMPLSLIQAGMVGIPSVATNVGSVSEVVKDNSTGYVVPENSSRIAEAIIKLASNKALYTEFSKNSIEFCNESFSLSRLCLDHKNIYVNLIDF